jgi:hypothetical protein
MEGSARGNYGKKENSNLKRRQLRQRRAIAADKPDKLF